MRNTWAVCKREFKSFFLTPIGYVVVGMAALIAGLAFWASFVDYAAMSLAPAEYAYSSVPDFEETLLSPYLVFCGMLVMFLTPLITMRLLAEEKNRGSIEMLFTLPLRDREIIFGKYLAALGMVLLVMLLIGVNLCIVYYYVDVEAPVLVFGLLTVFLMSAAFISLGLFVSSVTRNQITSGTITLGLYLIFYITGSMAADLPNTNPVPAVWPEVLRQSVGFLYAMFRYLLIETALDTHAKDMALGVVQPKDVAYYILFSSFFLFLTFRALESRHWRG